MIEITLTQFTPAQAEKITGIAVDQQRNLRRHGYLPHVEGHARFDGLGLARLAAIKVLSDRGIGPSLTAKADDGFDIATICATGVLWSMLDCVEAYVGDHETFAPKWPPLNPRTNSEKAAVLEHVKRLGHAEEDILAMLDDTARDWAYRSEWLKKQVILKLGLGRVIPARYFIWWADGTHVWRHDLEEEFSGSMRDSRYQGAIIVIDQQAVAACVLSRAGTAFAHIEEQPE